MTKKEHEKWLKKMGVHPEQLKKKKVKKSYRPSTPPTSYYEEKPLSGNPVFKHDSEKLDKSLSGVALKVYEESRTSPRDLGGDKDYSW